MPVRPERRAEYLRAWAAANRERSNAIKRAWAERNPEREKARRAKYKRENRAKVLANTRARQAAKLQATPAWASADKIAGMYVAAKQFEQAYGGKWHVDHIVPLRGKNVCGLHVENNLRLCPAEENQRKSNHHVA